MALHFLNISADLPRLGEAVDVTRAHCRDYEVMKLRDLAIAITAGAGAAVALLSSGLLYPRTDSPSSSNKPGISTTARDSSLLMLGDHGNVHVHTVASSSDSRAHSGSAPSGSVAPNSSAAMPIAIGTSPPNFQPSQRAKEAAFAAEALDPGWRHQKLQELSASLAVIEHEVESAQIDCRSSMCRVELVSRNTETLEEQSDRLKVWFEEVKRRGFQRMDSEFLPDGTTSLSYLFTKPMSLIAQLPLELNPEIIESFAQALRTNDHEQRAEPAQTFDPITWAGATSDRVIRRQE